MPKLEWRLFRIAKSGENIIVITSGVMIFKISGVNFSVIFNASSSLTPAMFALNRDKSL